MHFLIWIFLSFTSFQGAFAGQRDPETLFQKGLEAFRDGLSHRKEHPDDTDGIRERFRKAAELFVQCYKAGARSSNVLTNAGNSFYLAKDMGEAVLCWKRALSVDPSNEKARQNLEKVRAKMPFKRRGLSEGGLISSLLLWEDPRSFLWRYRAFAILFSAAWLLFCVELARARWRWIKVLLVPVFPFALVAAALGYLFRLTRPYAAVGAFCLVPALIFLASVFYEANDNRRYNEAVILVEVQGRLGDGTIYSPSHSKPFPPGTEVTILREKEGSEGKWVQVELPDGSSSWVPAETVERVLEEVGDKPK